MGAVTIGVEIATAYTSGQLAFGGGHAWRGARGANRGTESRAPCLFPNRVCIMSVWGIALALTAAARAGSVDVHGFGAESIGRGIGGVAVPDGGRRCSNPPSCSLLVGRASVGYGVTGRSQVSAGALGHQS